MSVGTTYDYATSTEQLRKKTEQEAVNSGKVSHTDFLKLLTKQLTTQDPLNPMQDLDFTAQLAQLQALDEQMAMTKSMAAMRLDSQLQAGTNMIGKYISGVDTNGMSASGLVTRVVQQDGTVSLELSNKQKVEVTSVGNVWNDAASMIQDLSNSGNIIGMWVEAGYDSAKQPIRGIVEKVMIENGNVKLKLYGGTTITLDQIQEMRAPTQDEAYYTLPDEVRLQVEKAQKMINRGVTGVDTNGNTVNGIVAQAGLDSSTNKVYLTLFSGEKIELSKVSGDARAPTADDATKSLKGLWASGLDADGNDASGIIAGAEQNDDGMAVVLEDGTRIYFEFLEEVRKPTDAEKAASND